MSGLDLERLVLAAGPLGYGQITIFTNNNLIVLYLHLFNDQLEQSIITFRYRFKQLSLSAQQTVFLHIVIFSSIVTRRTFLRLMQAAVDITFPYLHIREAFEEKIGKFQVRQLEEEDIVLVIIRKVIRGLLSRLFKSLELVWLNRD